MAKQIGELKITGTIDDMTYYKMDGEYYARRKSSLEGSRVKKDPRFKRTMESAQRLARGSQLASKVYRSLPKVEQVYTLYKELKSIAIHALKEAKSEAEVIKLLQQRVEKEKLPETPSMVKLQKLPLVHTAPSFSQPLFRVPGRRKEKTLGKKSRSQLTQVRRE